MKSLLTETYSSSRDQAVGEWNVLRNTVLLQESHKNDRIDRTHRSDEGHKIRIQNSGEETSWKASYKHDEEMD